MKLHVIARCTSVAVLASGAILLSWMLVEFTSAKLASLQSPPVDWDYAEMTKLRLDERPRFAIGEPVIGEAVTDYSLHRIPDGVELGRFGTYGHYEHRHSDGLPVVTAADAKALRSPHVARVVQAFTRARQRETLGDASELPRAFGNLVRTRLVLGSALLAAQDDDDERAWNIAVALVRVSQDYLGRSSLVDTTLMAARGKNATALMERLAARASASDAERWSEDLNKLMQDQLPARQIAVAIAIAEVRAARAMFGSNPRELGLATPRMAIAFAESPGDIAGGCAANGGGETLCGLIESAVARHAKIDDELNEIRETLIVRGKGGN